MNTTAWVLGLLGAPATAAFGRWAGFDRERSYYPVVLIVVATYYILFGAIAGSARVVLIETIAACCFVGLAGLGFKYDLRLVAVGLAGHGIFDFRHARLVPNPGVPPWWPEFCAAIDGALAAILLLLLCRGVLSRRPNDGPRGHRAGM